MTFCARIFWWKDVCVWTIRTCEKSCASIWYNFSRVTHTSTLYEHLMIVVLWRQRHASTENKKTNKTKSQKKKKTDGILAKWTSQQQPECDNFVVDWIRATCCAGSFSLFNFIILSKLCDCLDCFQLWIHVNIIYFQARKKIIEFNNKQNNFRHSNRKQATLWLNYVCAFYRDQTCLFFSLN